MDNDKYTNPEHYQGKLQPWDVIDFFFRRAYHLGAAFKYMARAGKKPYPGHSRLETELIEIGKAIAELNRHKELLNEELAKERESFQSAVDYCARNSSMYVIPNDSVVYNAHPRSETDLEAAVLSSHSKRFGKF